jgi:5-methylcytosine-specific restriction endonuclease McrA
MDRSKLKHPSAVHPHYRERDERGGVRTRWFQVGKERWEMKLCNKCGQQKPLSEFTGKKGNKDGLSCRCKDCAREYDRKWRDTNPEKSRSSSRKWKAAHIDDVYDMNRKWRAINPDKVRESVRKWAFANLDKVRESVRKYRNANPEKVLEFSRARRARVKGAGGKVTAKEWQWLKSFYDYTCLRCGKREPEIKLELDHVVPLVLGGENTIENSQPLCGSCNRSKNAKAIDYRRPLAF